MHPLLLRLPAICAALSILPSAWAQEPTTAPQELKELRQAVQMQTKQIELLAEQVARLTRALHAQQPGPEVNTPTTGTLSPPPSSGTLNIPPPTPGLTPSTSIAPKPLPPLPDVPPTAAPAPAAPRAEAVPTAEPVPGTKHIVAKGETLTSIAKQYNISLTELKNANKIENDRKLQIGQILSVPTPKAPESPDKKENP